MPQGCHTHLEELNRQGHQGLEEGGGEMWRKLKRGGGWHCEQGGGIKTLRSLSMTTRRALR